MLCGMATSNRNMCGVVPADSHPFLLVLACQCYSLPTGHCAGAGVQGLHLTCSQPIS